MNRGAPGTAGSVSVEEGGIKVDSDDKKSWAADLLRQKEKQLGRMPRKDDFDEATRSRIKAFLGPWPRALEAAGLKEPKEQRPASRREKEAALKSKNQCMAAKQKLEKKRKSAENVKWQSEDKRRTQE